MWRNECDQAKLDIQVERDLRVTVTPAKPVVGPGEAVELDVTTVDQLGRPVSAELSIAMVDQSLLRLYQRHAAGDRPVLLQPDPHRCLRDRGDQHVSLCSRRRCRVAGRGRGGRAGGGGGGQRRRSQGRACDVGEQGQALASKADRRQRMLTPCSSVGLGVQAAPERGQRAPLTLGARGGHEGAGAWTMEALDHRRRSTLPPSPSVEPQILRGLSEARQTEEPPAARRSRVREAGGYDRQGWTRWDGRQKPANSAHRTGSLGSTRISGRSPPRERFTRRRTGTRWSSPARTARRGSHSRPRRLVGVSHHGRGVTGADTLAGQTTATLTVRKELLRRPQGPRLAHPGRQAAVHRAGPPHRCRWQARAAAGDLRRWAR